MVAIMKALLVQLFIWWSTTTAISDPSDCSRIVLQDSHKIDVVYDLTPFKLNSEVFEVDDNQRAGFKYKFNVCSQIDSAVFASETIPVACRKNATGPCTQIVNGTCEQMLDVDARVPYAVQTVPGKCFWLGMQMPAENFSHAVNFDVELYDSDNAGRGVIVTMYNGSWCEKYQTNRKLTVHLECPDLKRFEFKPDALLAIKETVTETDCAYYVYYESPLACPSQCVENLGILYSVCSGNGICVSDPVSRSVRCICDDGWGGTYCSESHALYVVEEADHTGLLAAVIVCGILLVIAVIVSALLCHKIRLRESDNLSDVDKTYFQGMLQEENQAQMSSLAFKDDEQEIATLQSASHEKRKREQKEPTVTGDSIGDGGVGGVETQDEALPEATNLVETLDDQILKDNQDEDEHQDEQATEQLVNDQNTETVN